MTTFTEHNEKKLLHLVAKSDETAFRELFDLYRDRIYSLGMYLTRSEIVSEEIVQDVFIKVWEKREQLLSIEYFNAWLRTVARNICSNYLRSMAIEKLALKTYTAAIPSSNESPENTIIEKEQEQLLNTAILNLPPQQKKVYLLSRQGGKKQEEIAREMNISIYTVKEYMKLAQRSVRQHLENYIDKTVLLAVMLYL